METIPITEAKARIAELADRVAREHDHFTITRNGRADVMLISVAEYESMQETLDILEPRTLIVSPTLIPHLAGERVERDGRCAILCTDERYSLSRQATLSARISLRQSKRRAQGGRLARAGPDPRVSDRGSLSAGVSWSAWPTSPES